MYNYAFEAEYVVKVNRLLAIDDITDFDSSFITTNDIMTLEDEFGDCEINIKGATLTKLKGM